MAISKIINMKDCGNAFHGKHLKRSIDYITESRKTQKGRLVGVLNCLPENVYEQMRATKLLFDKNKGRQGYHIVLSFKPGEADEDKAYEIAGKFARQYLGTRYEVVYSVHNNTECVHAHIVWNSVSFVDGRKYRYEKGDWEKDILPIVNDLCREYGLSVLELDEEQVYEKRAEKKSGRTGKSNWNHMIKRDLDACVLQAVSFSDFEKLLREKGYVCKDGKHFAVRPPGMERFRRCDTLGIDYTKEKLIKRIETENIRTYAASKQSSARIVRCHVKRYRRAKLSGLQKKYYAKLYRIGILKKKPYSQAWKYRDEIQKLQKFQRQYLFLEKYDIRSILDLTAILENLQAEDVQTVSEKKRVYKEKQRFKSLFEVIDKMKALENAHIAYLNGDNFFIEEQNLWMVLEEQLRSAGYTYDEVQTLRVHFKQRITEVTEQEARVKRELAIGNAVWRDIDKKDSVEELEKDKTEEKERTLPVR